jgi:Domain of unknown function (DUF5606)
MEYNKIIAVTGLPGLYELLSSKSDGAIVRSLDDKSTRFVSSRVHNFSHLESIEVYTVRDNVNLVDVLKAMEASSEKVPDEKDNSTLKAYFSKVYPDLDFDRVYSSDLKKMVKWFNVLRSNNIEIKLSEPEEGAEEVEAGAEPEVKEEKTKKATAAAGNAKESKGAGNLKTTAEAAEPAKAKAPAAKKIEVAEEEKPKAAAKKAASPKTAGEAKAAASKKATEEKPAAEKKQPGKTAKKKS